MDAHLKTGGEEQYIRSQNTNIHATEETLAAFKELKVRRKHRFIVYKATENGICVETLGERSGTDTDLLAALPHSECRYAIYDHEATTDDGRKVSKLYFISWLPENANPSMKMAYTHGKTLLRSSFDGCFDVNGSTNLEIQRGIGAANPDDEDSNSEFEDD